MDIVVVLIVVVAIVAIGLFLTQSRLGGRTPFGRRGGGLARRRGADPGIRRREPTPGEERALIREGEAIRERVEEDLRRNPPDARARALARRVKHQPLEPDPRDAADDARRTDGDPEEELRREIAERSRDERRRERRSRRDGQSS